MASAYVAAPVSIREAPVHVRAARAGNFGLMDEVTIYHNPH
ncbi:hypothetical protein [Candidatus Poriferisodalis multihospitum]|nr:hypothetical protein [Candidatus Poriferisodalis multihospitum]